MINTNPAVRHFVSGRIHRATNWISANPTRGTQYKTLQTKCGVAPAMTGFPVAAEQITHKNACRTCWKGYDL